MTLSVTATESVSESADDSQAYYVLEGVNPGDAVTVTLTSNEFDTYLYVIDASSETYLFENDDNPDITPPKSSLLPKKASRTGWKWQVSVALVGGLRPSCHN